MTRSVLAFARPSRESGGSVRVAGHLAQVSGVLREPADRGRGAPSARLGNNGPGRSLSWSQPSYPKGYQPAYLRHADKSTGME
jgi:hypothetical protein